MSSKFDFEAEAVKIQFAMERILSEEGVDKKIIIKIFKQNREERLKRLVENAINGEITKETFDKMLVYEERIFVNELVATKLVSRAVAQKIANEVIDILLKIWQTFKS